MSKTNLVVAFLLAAVLAGLFVSVNGGSPMASLQTKESFMQQPMGMPVDGSMGPYDGASAQGVSGWSSTEPHSAAPMTGNLPSQSDAGDLNFLVGNRVNPSCCPAAFTTDTGCVCLSESDKDFMGSRAGNRA
jgi:hypothetical protein